MSSRSRRRTWLRLGLALSAVAAGSVLWGWTHGPQPDPAAGAGPVTEVGNVRPAVLRYDGSMVHRCEAVAVSVRSGADADTVRAALHDAGDRVGLPLLDLAPGVLPAAFLEVTVPDVVACLPVGVAAGDAARLPEPLPGEDRRSVQAVLVHDLAFVVRPARGTPQETADAADREGVLADVLGRYTVDTTTAGQLQVRYTGQLLGDDEVDTVRAALARSAGVPVAAVWVRPGDPAGPGVDLRHQSAAPAVLDSPAPHHH